jgi:hypothetical protein
MPKRGNTDDTRNDTRNPKRVKANVIKVLQRANPDDLATTLVDCPVEVRWRIYDHLGPNSIETIRTFHPDEFQAYAKHALATKWFVFDDEEFLNVYLSGAITLLPSRHQWQARLVSEESAHILYKDSGVYYTSPFEHSTYKRHVHSTEYCESNPHLPFDPRFARHIRWLSLKPQYFNSICLDQLAGHLYGKITVGDLRYLEVAFPKLKKLRCCCRVIPVKWDEDDTFSLYTQKDPNETTSEHDNSSETTSEPDDLSETTSESDDSSNIKSFVFDNDWYENSLPVNGRLKEIPRCRGRLAEFFMWKSHRDKASKHYDSWQDREKQIAYNHYNRAGQALAEIKIHQVQWTSYKKSLELDLQDYCLRRPRKIKAPYSFRWPSPDSFTQLVFQDTPGFRDTDDYEGNYEFRRIGKAYRWQITGAEQPHTQEDDTDESDTRVDDTDDRDTDDGDTDDGDTDDGDTDDGDTDDSDTDDGDTDDGNTDDGDTDDSDTDDSDTDDGDTEEERIEKEEERIRYKDIMALYPF